MSKVLNVSRNTVAEVQALFLQSGRSWDDISEWDDDRLYELFYPDKFKYKPRYAPVDYSCVHMDEKAWLSCHVNMFQFFGGTPVKIVCDNLKTGVTSHPKRGESILNEAYNSMTNHSRSVRAAAGASLGTGEQAHKQAYQECLF